MTDTAGIAGNRILSFIERVEHIDEELKALTERKKEVFSEAKGEGFDVKVLKEILRMRKQDKDERDEQDFCSTSICGRCRTRNPSRTRQRRTGYVKGEGRQGRPFQPSKSVGIVSMDRSR